MHATLERLGSDERLPAEVDVVVIGAGIVGSAAAYYLARAGHRTALVEKGFVGAEQSSRNWGWCRQQNRDAREMPLAQRALELWEAISRDTGRDAGFRRCGLLYATNDASQIAQWETWRDTTAKTFGVDTRMLTGAEAAALATGSTAAWRGGCTR